MRNPELGSRKALRKFCYRRSEEIFARQQATAHGLIASSHIAKRTNDASHRPTNVGVLGLLAASRLAFKGNEERKQDEREACASDMAKRG
ncbi:hypothetical protein [Variovorax paradoxus]|uniref:hypothetical protein n=1 Tax=Variovorax paradoxus TaxID=34073 RepID=UPI001ABCE50F